MVVVVEVGCDDNSIHTDFRTGVRARQAIACAESSPKGEAFLPEDG